MTAFEEYLALYEIDAVRLSIEAHVRYGTIHLAKEGNPITLASAQKIKDAVLRVTGKPFTGSFVLLEEQFDQFPYISDIHPEQYN